MNDIDALDIDSDEEPKIRKRKKITNGFTVPVSAALGTSVNATHGATVQASPPLGKRNIDPSRFENRRQESDACTIARLFAGEEIARINSGRDPITALFEQAKQGQDKPKHRKASRSVDDFAEKGPPVGATSREASNSRIDKSSEGPPEKCHALSAGSEIPGPAGRLQRALARGAPFSISDNPAAARKKPKSNQHGVLDINFLSNAWTAGSQVIAQNKLIPDDGRDSIKKVLSQTSHEKIKQMLVFVSDIRANGERSAFARVKDPTGNMGAILHHTTLSSHPNISPGVVLLLKEVTVFSPSSDVSYLCIMPDNIKKVLRESSDDPALPADTLHQRLNESSSPHARQNGMIHSQFPTWSASFPSKPRPRVTPSAWTNRPVLSQNAFTSSPQSQRSIDDVLNQFRDTPKVNAGSSSSLISHLGTSSDKQERRKSCETMPPPPPRTTPQTSADSFGTGLPGNGAQALIRAETNTEGILCGSLGPSNSGLPMHHQQQDDYVASTNINRQSVIPGAGQVKVEDSGELGGRGSHDESPGNVLDLFEEVRECYGMLTQRSLGPSVEKERGFVGPYQSTEISLDDAFTQKK